MCIRDSMYYWVDAKFICPFWGGARNSKRSKDSMVYCNITAVSIVDQSNIVVLELTNLWSVRQCSGNDNGCLKILLKATWLLLPTDPLSAIISFYK